MQASNLKSEQRLTGGALRAYSSPNQQLKHHAKMVAFSFPTSAYSDKLFLTSTTYNLVIGCKWADIRSQRKPDHLQIWSGWSDNILIPVHSACIYKLH